MSSSAVGLPPCLPQCLTTAGRASVSHLYSPFRPSSRAILCRASKVPRYRGALPPVERPMRTPMCCVCSRVLTTHKGFVMVIVATPAPAAAAMCTADGCIRGLPAFSFTPSARPQTARHAAALAKLRVCPWITNYMLTHILTAQACISFGPACVRIATQPEYTKSCLSQLACTSNAKKWPWSADIKAVENMRLSAQQPDLICLAGAQAQLCGLSQQSAPCAFFPR